MAYIVFPAKVHEKFFRNDSNGGDLVEDGVCKKIFPSIIVNLAHKIKNCLCQDDQHYSHVQSKQRLMK